MTLYVQHGKECKRKLLVPYKRLLLGKHNTTYSSSSRLLSVATLHLITHKNMDGHLVYTICNHLYWKSIMSTDNLGCLKF